MNTKALFFVTLAIFAIVFAEDDETAAPADEDIKVEVLQAAPEDCERKTKRNDLLSMHYTGTLTDTGKKFDSSLDRGQPFEFQLGAGQVIKGWDEGLTDMCIGEKRKLTIPASKGYGEQGAGELIPPNSGLTFEVELVEIKDGTAPPNVFKEIDEDNDKMLTREEVAKYLKKQAKAAGDEAEAVEEQHNEIIEQIFNHEDKDKDGFIDHDEFSGPKHDEL